MNGPIRCPSREILSALPCLSAGVSNPDAVPLHLVVERGPVDAEDLGRLELVAVGLRQRLNDRAPLAVDPDSDCPPHQRAARFPERSPTRARENAVNASCNSAGRSNSGGRLLSAIVSSLASTTAYSIAFCS